MTKCDRYPEWDMSQCRRAKICDWRCLAKDILDKKHTTCVGCGRHRRRPLPSLNDATEIIVTVNGERLSCERGTLLVDLLETNGIYIPTLCHHPRLEPCGTCRICLVEIAHGDTVEAVTACTYHIETPISVTTDNPLLEAHRTKIVRELIEKAPTSEPIRLLAAKLGLPSPSLGNSNHCILCEKCIRVANDIIGCAALTVNGDDCVVKKEVSLSQDERCEVCGACRVVCPTSAVPVKPPRAMAHTECRLCELICPELAISTDKKSGEIRVDLARCKKCGLCVDICPENAVSLVAPSSE